MFVPAEDNRSGFPIKEFGNDSPPHLNPPPRRGEDITKGGIVVARNDGIYKDGVLGGKEI